MQRLIHPAAASRNGAYFQGRSERKPYGFPAGAMMPCYTQVWHHLPAYGRFDAQRERPRARRIPERDVHCHVACLVSPPSATRFAKIKWAVDIMNLVLYSIDVYINNLELPRDTSSITSTRRGRE